MSREDKMANIDPRKNPEVYADEDEDEYDFAAAVTAPAPAEVAAGVAAAAGRTGDHAYVEYLTALNEVTGAGSDAQVTGVARLGRLISHPEHGTAAAAILESFVAEATVGSDGTLASSAVLLAKEILAVRTIEEPQGAEPTALVFGADMPVPAPVATSRTRTAIVGMIAAAIRDRPWAWVVALAGAFAAGMGNFGYAWLLGLLADHTRAGATGVSLAAAAAGAVVAFALVRGAGVYTTRVLSEQSQIRLAGSDRLAAVRTYLRRPPMWMDRTAFQLAQSVVRGDGERTWYAAAAVPFVLGTVLAALIAIGVLVHVHLVAAITLALLLTALVASTSIMLRRLKPPSDRIRTLTAAVQHAAADLVDEAATTGPAQVGAGLSQQLRTATRALRDERGRLDTIRGRFAVLLDHIPPVGLMLAAPATLALGGPAGPGSSGPRDALVIVVTLVLLLALPVRASAALIGELAAGAIRHKRLLHLLAGGEMAYGQRALPPTRGRALHFEGTSLLDGDGREILARLSLTVHAGHLVAVAGASAEEAEAIVALAARIEDPTGGAVTLDNADLRELTPDSLAAAVLWAPDADAVRAALKARDKPGVIVISDVPQLTGSAAEPDAISAIRAAGVTALVLTNRRTVLALADQVVVLDGGTVVGQGTHDCLLERLPTYPGLIIRSEGDEQTCSCRPVDPECTAVAPDEATEHHHHIDRLAAAAAAPRSFAVLRRGGTTCHACRTNGRKRPVPRPDTTHVDADPMISGGRDTDREEISA
jgi:ABC-type multidrug transport system fused ATPase/permease subunit